MKYHGAVLVMIGVMMILSVVAWAQQNLDKGADMIQLNLDRAMAEVDFPHHVHQNVVNDCDACHMTFPMAAGIIEEKITRREFRKQQIMNDVCLDCHRAMKTAGQSTGPVACNQCHIRR